MSNAYPALASRSSVFRGGSAVATRVVAAVCAGLMAMGCAAAAKQAAKSAAPAAVEGAIEEAKDPSTRDAVAEILNDRDIRASSTLLSQAVTQGLVRGVEKEMPLAQVEQLTDALVARVGASVARSLERDVGPQLSLVVGRMMDESLAHALNEQTEERLQAVVASLTRATLGGVTEGVSGVNGNDGDPLNAPSAALSRNAWYSLGYNGAHGFERAVIEAHLKDGEGVPSILATLGTVAGWVRFVPLLLLGVGALLILGLSTALIWALVALRRERRWTQRQAPIESELSQAEPLGQDAGRLEELAKRVTTARRATRHSY
jgi:hypothetical protein